MKTLPQIFEELHTSERGLGSEEAARRLTEYGPNALPEGKREHGFIIFLRQFKSPLIYVLLAAGVIVFVNGETADAVIILAVLLFNAVIGTFQEGRAQNILLALNRFTEAKATVLRDEKEIIILDKEIVPGDIILLEEGEKVPADARIVHSRDMRVDEAALTGESEPVRKIDGTLPGANIPISDQKNMLFRGTNILRGGGKAIVYATGENTEIGKIAKEVGGINTEIPLQADIRALSQMIIKAVGVISVVLFFAGIMMGIGAKDMFATVVSLAVSVIPEGLPVVMTIVLAVGVFRMSKRNALVKKMHAVEALGQARVVAVDKTGTLTKNEMVIQKVYVDGKIFDIGGSGYEPAGVVRLQENAIDPANHPELLLAGKIAAYCASARVIFSEEKKLWQISGDPTEAAMLVLAQKLGFHKDDVEREAAFLAEIPFSYELKYHTTLHQDGEKKILTVVGAPEKVLELCDTVWHNGKNEQLSAAGKQALEDALLHMSEDGLRIVALSKAEEIPEPLDAKNLGRLTFVGFFGMRDGLRPEVKEAVESALLAGIRVVMITGDHKATARAIAKEAGIYREGDTVLTGAEIDILSEKEFIGKLSGTSVFARVTPEHKLKIVMGFKSRGEIIAMTGDGVNDAPSLVAADLGVAMGKIGTEVAKEASDIVLLDDNFATIVAAVEEGRSIYKTLKKVILYLFSTSAGEVLAIGGSLFLGLPLLLLPAQIIWLNFITDGFLVAALAMEPKEKGLLRGYFKRPKKYFLDALMIRRIFIMGIPMMIGSILLFNQYVEGSWGDLAKASTIALTTLAVFQWFNAWNCRSEKLSVFRTNPFSNLYLVGATVLVILFQLLALYHPVMQDILHTTSLSLSEWLMIIPVAFSVIVVEEVRKFLARRSRSHVL
ncbi:HAD-IC family P-type ATPase [bacterium]|nr:HAD-IC family P-type ATPase [bacterium]